MGGGCRGWAQALCVCLEGVPWRTPSDPKPWLNGVPLLPLAFLFLGRGTDM